MTFKQNSTNSDSQHAPLFQRLACLLVLLLSVSANAQDRVTFIPENATRPVTLVGEILDYNGTALRFKNGSGETKTIASSSIDGIETHYSNSYLNGIRLFEAGETTNALQMFKLALGEETRQWVDREIRAWIVKCYHRQLNFPAALMEFEKLVNEDPESRHWNIAPLVWTPISTSDEVRAQSRQWIIGSSSANLLLGASILLLDPTYSKSAENTMKRLAQDANPNISVLARCQLWRIDLSNRKIDDFSLNRWRDEIDHMPAHLRNGPQFLLAAALNTDQQYRKSAAEFMWVPLVYNENEPLDARATWEAGEALERAGLTSEANLLYQEVVSRYPWANEAKTARSKIKM